MSDPLMIALIGAIGVVIGALITAIPAYLTQRRAQLLRECRLAVRDLKRFRDLEPMWAEELSSLKPGSNPLTETKRLHNRLEEKTGEGFGLYHQPAKIRKLLDQLE